MSYRIPNIRCAGLYPHHGSSYVGAPAVVEVVAACTLLLPLAILALGSDCENSDDGLLNLPLVSSPLGGVNWAQARVASQSVLAESRGRSDLT